MMRSSPFFSEGLQNLRVLGSTSPTAAMTGEGLIAL